MRVCSLFSGIGGIDLGFQQAGFDIVWANEFDKDAARTYRHNFGTSHLVEADIRSVDPSAIPDFDVLVAGFPCQPFSIMGFKKGFKDPRGNLFFEIARIAEAKLPKVIFLENVANLLEHDEGKSFLTVYNALVPLGYTFKYQVMDAMEYAGFKLVRGCGCRSGFCGACAVIYRINGSTELKVVLSCQTKVEEGMCVGKIDSFPVNKRTFTIFAQ